MCFKTGEGAHTIIRSITKRFWFSGSKMSIIDILFFFICGYRARSSLSRNEVQVVNDCTLVEFCRKVCIDAVVTEQSLLGIREKRGGH